MHEKWAHRADLTQAAIAERHARHVWGVPGTNLAVVAWPPRMKDQLFVRWHYWWQAHYLDCLIDAAVRRPTPVRLKEIKATMRGIRLRNITPITANSYYDDRAWLGLALQRTREVPKLRRPGNAAPLIRCIMSGVDSSCHAVPWREGQTYFNVPTNGPAAMLLARTGELSAARRITDWVFDNLRLDNGMIADGLRLRMDGHQINTATYAYCQGVMLGACLDIVNGLRTRVGVAPDACINIDEHPQCADAVALYSARIEDLVRGIACHMATASSVINAGEAGGDGGLFPGILARYLANVAVSFPGDTKLNRATKKIAARLVVRSAESVWNHRLEVDGLPVCGADWTSDAQLPRNGGVIASSHKGSVSSSMIAERDLSVQLSGLMLMEAAAKVTAHEDYMAGLNDG